MRICYLKWFADFINSVKDYHDGKLVGINSNVQIKNSQLTSHLAIQFQWCSKENVCFFSLKNISREDSFHLLSPEKTYNFEFLANRGINDNTGTAWATYCVILINGPWVTPKFHYCNFVAHWFLWGAEVQYRTYYRSSGQDVYKILVSWPGPHALTHTSWAVMATMSWSGLHILSRTS